MRVSDEKSMQPTYHLANPRNQKKKKNGGVKREMKKNKDRKWITGKSPAQVQAQGQAQDQTQDQAQAQAQPLSATSFRIFEALTNP